MSWKPGGLRGHPVVSWWGSGCLARGAVSHNAGCLPGARGGPGTGTVLSASCHRPLCLPLQCPLTFAGRMSKSSPGWSGRPRSSAQGARAAERPASTGPTLPPPLLPGALTWKERPGEVSEELPEGPSPVSQRRERRRNPGPGIPRGPMLPARHVSGETLSLPLSFLLIWGGGRGSGGERTKQCKP